MCGMGTVSTAPLPTSMFLVSAIAIARGTIHANVRAVKSLNAARKRTTDADVTIAETVTQDVTARDGHGCVMEVKFKKVSTTAGSDSDEAAVVPIRIIPWIGRVERSVPSFQH